MTRFTVICAAASLAVMSVSGHAEDALSKEQALVACVQERDPELLVTIRDADTQEKFVEAMRKALALCDIAEAERMSLAKIYEAIAEKIGKPQYQAGV